MEKSSSKSIMVVAGEVSSDNHCAPIFEKLRAQHPDLKIWGIGGEKMKAAGVELVYENKQLSVLGLVEGLKLIPVLARVRKELLSRINQENTSMVMLVDYGGFNLQLASDIRSSRRDLPVLYFISPQIWAARPWRIKTIKKNTSKILVIFPFEEPLFRQNGVAARFVGHPLLKNIPRTKDLPDRQKFCADHGLDAEKPLVSIFTGSRRQEIRGHAPVVIQAIKEVLEMKPETQFVVSLTNETLGEILKAEISKAGLPEKSVAFVGATENYAAIAACDLVWAKSGTTTLEVAMFGKPMLIFYRGSWLSFIFVMLYKQIKNVGLPNILAGKTLVPELLQLDCRAQQLVRYTLDLLDVPGLRKEISQELLEIRDQLGKGNYVDNCIEEIVKTLQLN